MLTFFVYFFSLQTSVCPFYFIFVLWFFCESCSALQELCNDIQHDHIQKKSQPCGAQGSKSAIFIFLQQLKLYARPLWLHVFFFTSQNPITKIKYSPVVQLYLWEIVSTLLLFTSFSKTLLTTKRRLTGQVDLTSKAVDLSTTFLNI